MTLIALTIAVTEVLSYVQKYPFIIRCMVSFDKLISQSVSLSPVINQLLVNIRGSICVGLFFLGKDQVYCLWSIILNYVVKRTLYMTFVVGNLHCKWWSN